MCVDTFDQAPNLRARAWVSRQTLLNAFLACDLADNYNPAAHEMLAKVSRRSISFITSWPARLYYIGVRHYAFYSISRAKRIRDVADEFSWDSSLLYQCLVSVSDLGSVEISCEERTP